VPSAKAQKQLAIATEVKQMRQCKRLKIYGAPRLQRELKKQGIECSKNTVAKVIKQSGLTVQSKRKYRATTDSKHAFPMAPNRLEQCFATEKINSVWLTDITYVPIRDGFAYLCCVEDLCSRRIVGWSIALHMEASLALDSINQAIALRAPSKGLIVHSDRGSQFASEVYRNRLEQCGFEQSMSRKGNCYDNAPMESFFRSFKVEDANQQPYETIEHATREIADYIDRFYNPVRLHSSLGYQSPMQFEKGQIESLEVCN
jgi:transposase InsO family protein